MSTTDLPSCAVAAFLGQDIAKDICDTLVLKTFLPRFVRSTEGWIFSTHTSLTLSITCGQVTVHRDKVDIQGVGLLRLHQDCSAWGDELILPAETSIIMQSASFPVTLQPETMVSPSISELLVTTNMKDDLDTLFQALPGPASMTELVIGAQRHAPVRETQGVFRIVLITLIMSFIIYVILTVSGCLLIGVRARHLRRENMEKMLTTLRGVTDVHPEMLPLQTSGAAADTVDQDDGVYPSLLTMQHQQ